jgi:hypothetical protein
MSFRHITERLLVHFLYLLGLYCAVYGCWLIYHPAGWIIGGALLVAFSLLLDKGMKESDESR